MSCIDCSGTGLVKSIVNCENCLKTKTYACYLCESCRKYGNYVICNKCYGLGKILQLKTKDEQN